MVASEEDAGRQDYRFSGVLPQFSSAPRLFVLRQQGPKIPANRAETLQIAQLTRERDGLKRELDEAMLVIGVQKKLATLLGILSDKDEKL